MSITPLINAKPLLTFSTGLFAGLGTTLSYCAVPAIKSSSDPLPAWQQMYSRGKNMALSLIITASGASVKLYLDSGHTDWRYLLCGGLMFAVVPYTALVMVPTNNELKAIRAEDGKKVDAAVRTLIKKWEKMQYVRTALGLAAFFVNVWIMNTKFVDLSI